MQVTDVGERIFNIPEVNFGKFEERISKLQRRADKLGCAKVSYEVMGTYHAPEGSRVLHGEEGDQIVESKRMIKFFQIRISGEAPKLLGWTFVAKLEHDPELGTGVFVMPGQVLPEALRSCDSRDCDQCHKALFRRDTFIVKNEAGEFKHIGRQCLRDFLGHENPEGVASFCEYLADLYDFVEECEGFDHGSHGVYYFDLKQVLVGTAAAIRKYGWLSRTKARETEAPATSSYVARWMDLEHELLEPLDEDRTEAQAIITWAKNLTEAETDENDYLYNIKRLADAGLTNDQRFGFACSMVIVYRNTINRANEAKAAQLSREYFGAIGQRTLIGEVEVLGIHGPFESRFGPSYVYRFKQGNFVFVWFTGTRFNWEVGDKIIIEKATVKAHQEWKGLKETVIGRSKIKENKK